LTRADHRFAKQLFGMADQRGVHVGDHAVHIEGDTKRHDVYSLFKSTSAGSGTTASSERRMESGSNFGVVSSPHPRQPQRSQRCGRLVVNALRHDSMRFLVCERWIDDD